MAGLFDSDGKPISTFSDNAIARVVPPILPAEKPRATYILKAEGERSNASQADTTLGDEREADYIKAVCFLRNAAEELYWTFHHGQLKPGTTRAFIERARNKLYVLELNAKALEPEE